MAKKGLKISSPSMLIGLKLVHIRVLSSVILLLSEAEGVASPSSELVEVVVIGLILVKHEGLRIHAAMGHTAILAADHLAHYA